ncbi:GntR family transcriptional regulator [soil metagenome]
MDSSGLIRGLRSQVADRLRDDILTGRLKPGEKLAETQLVKRFGVSRAPVREALVQLTQEGLLTSKANRGVRVTEPASNDLQELFLPIRELIELHALKLAFPKLTPEHFRRWTEILGRMKAACQARDFAMTSETDIAFHRVILDACGEPDIVQLWTSLVGRLRAYFQNSHSQYSWPLDIYREHDLILGVFQNGKLVEALAALKASLVATETNPLLSM